MNPFMCGGRVTNSRFFIGVVVLFLKCILDLNDIDAHMTTKKYDFKNPKQVINMGGPWIGDFYFNDNFISRNIIMDNLLFSDNKIYFVRYHSPSKKRSDVFFTIGYWDVDVESLSESIQTFGMLYLKEIVNDKEMIICNAFHGKIPESCFNFIINPDAFHAVGNIA